MNVRANILLAVGALAYCSSSSSARLCLAWDDGGSPEIGGFKIHRGRSSGNYGKAIDVGLQASYCLRGLKVGATYFFAVTAYDATRTISSDFSNEISVTIVPRNARPQSSLSELEGVVNLALNSSVSASSLQTGSMPPSAVVDGKVDTTWSSEPQDPQWIEIDLGRRWYINAVTLKWDDDYAASYRIEVSRDLMRWTNLFETSTGTGGEEHLTSISGIGRYIRMYGVSRGTGSGYSLREFEVYGTPWPAGVAR
jgi:hypothetical protein